MIKYSIIVPAYNAASYISRCIDSILHQQYGEFEIFLINDGSTDGTLDICKRYEESDSRVHVLDKKNGGVNAARRYGLEYVKGEYVCFVDSDDWVSENWLDAVNREVVTKNADIVSYNYISSGKKERFCRGATIQKGTYQRNRLQEYVFPNMLSNQELPFFEFGVMPALWSKVYRRDIIIQNYCKDDRLSYGEDTATVYQCFLDAKIVSVIDEHLYYYRANPASITRKYIKNRFQNNEYLIEYLKKTLCKRGYSLQQQIDNYEYLILIYAILNEAKDKRSIKECANICKDLLATHGYKEMIENIRCRKCKGIWKIFTKLLSQKNYTMLILYCRLINKIKLFIA